MPALPAMRLRSSSGRNMRADVDSGPPSPGRSRALAFLMSRRRLCFPVTVLMVVCLAITWITSSPRIAEERKSWELRSLAGDGLDPTPWHTSRGVRLNIVQWLIRRQQLRRCTAAALCTTGSGPAAQGGESVSTAAADGEAGKALPWRPAVGDRPARAACPDFFRWIFNDLAPWKETGIREANVMAGKEFAAFRVVILNGDLYVDMYYRCVQSRGLFTLWSLVQLLERFPGQVTDVDFMFDCMDRPQFEKARFLRAPGVAQPALLRYCSTDEHLDIPFPDWSFWGWPEVRLKQWHNQSASILRGSEQLQWRDRDDWVYWRGNPYVGSPTREQLMLCNQSSQNPASKARILRQDWKSEAGAAADGPRDSDVARHCDHKYMVCAEGYAWSASYKYIMACGSPVLAIASNYYDFFTRGLLPMHHYVPVRAGDICSSIHALVMAGNAVPKKMKHIGERGQRFMLNDLSMGNVYSYMFHLLNEYSKLMRYQPAVPPGAQRVCRSKILCLASEEQLPFLLDTSTDPEIDAQPGHGRAGNTHAYGGSLRPCSLPPGPTTLTAAIACRHVNLCEQTSWSPAAHVAGARGLSPRHNFYIEGPRTGTRALRLDR